MGYSRSSADDWTSYAASTSTKSYDDLVRTKTASAVKDEYLPKNIKLRESRDSAANPRSRAVILASDNTGSMHILAEQLIRTGLSTTFKAMLERAKPDPDTGKVLGLPDPHVMCMSVGDAWADPIPMTVTQFESDLKIAEQTAELWVGRGGGNNQYESYNLPWYFAATRTSIDCWEKRREKGFLFTIGDEPPPPCLTKEHALKVFGDTIEADIPTADILAMAERTYEVFHVVIEEGSHFRQYPNEVREGWQKLLGQRVIFLSDHTKLAETVISTIEVTMGRDKRDSAKAWSGDTALVVARAIANVDKHRGGIGGLTRF